MMCLLTCPDTLEGETCHQYLRDREAVLIRGPSTKDPHHHSHAAVCDVTLTAASDAFWMLHVQNALILDCGVKVIVYDTRIATVSVKPVVS